MNRDTARQARADRLQNSQWMQRIQRDFLHVRLTPETMRAIKQTAIEGLATMRERGEIPEQTPLWTQVLETGPSHGLQIILPLFLELWVAIGDLVVFKQFKHHCDSYVFLARSALNDFYFCEQRGLTPAVIARFGEAPQEYKSGITIARRSGTSHPLGMAYQLAYERGLVPAPLTFQEEP